MYSAMAGSGGAIDTRGIIEESNRKAYDSALKEMNDEYDGIIAAISDRQKEIAGISKEFSIGGFSGPSVTQGTGGPKPVNNLAELEAKALQKIEDQKIEIMRQGTNANVRKPPCVSGARKSVSIRRSASVLNSMTG